MAKKRLGFVANSSSSSFIIKKETIEEDKIEEVETILDILAGIDLYDGSYEERENYYIVYIGNHIDMDSVFKLAKLHNIDLVEDYPDED